MSRSGSWKVERHVGDAFRLHGMEPEPTTGRRALVLTVDRPALVLGSTQDATVVRHDRLAELGIDLVRRHSGGSAVLLLPTESIWLDLVLPRDDPLVHDDVGTSFHWVGELWADALSSVGLQAQVHHGAAISTRWSPLVCFAGLGPGEVVVDGLKTVGISQRHTRRWVRFQCLANRTWPGGELLDLLALDDDERIDAAGEIAAGALEAAASSAIGAVLERLPD